MPSEMRRLKQLEEENARLKRIVADLSLDKEMPQTMSAESSKACSQTSARRRGAYGLEGGDPAACDVVGFERSTYHYRSVRRN
jgi:hypothetical protein